MGKDYKWTLPINCRKYILWLAPLEVKAHKTGWAAVYYNL
jgi:hypothetical protein